MEDFPDKIHEQREELVVSQSAGTEIPTLTQGHFLRPTAASMHEPGLKHPSDSFPSKNPTLDLKRLARNVSFKAWIRPVEYWKKWVRSLKPKYQSLWKKAGIFEPIMFSTYEIRQHKALVLAIAEKWNPETNTFVLPWGESTITLEDVIVLGGFSVLGESVHSPLLNQEMIEVKEKLNHANGQIGPYIMAWVFFFMGSGNELEHEAFLIFWLSIFVFVTPTSHDFIHKKVFDVAIHLARGIRIALATDVLCGIYRDLRMIVEELLVPRELNDKSCELFAPFQLVQLWVWERFPSLSPTPNLISCGEPRVARWQGLRVAISDVRQAIDSAGDSFQWRPYCMAVKSWNFPKFYGDEAQWIVTSNKDLDEEIESFSRCLRPSELVGRLCLEPYHPHRVAMQFGFDQDIPSLVRFDGDGNLAWKNYSRPIGDDILYIPPRLLEADVTKRYSDWWNRKVTVSVHCDFVKPFVRRPRSAKRNHFASVRKEEYYNLIPATKHPKEPQVVRNGDDIVYIHPHLLEADVTKRYSDWWNRKVTVSVHCDFVKPFVRRPRSAKRNPFASVRKEEYYNLIPATKHPKEPQVVSNGTGGSIKGSEHMVVVEKSSKDTNTFIGLPSPVCKSRDLSDPAMNEEIRMHLDENEQAKSTETPFISLEIETENETRSHTVELPRLEIEDRICRLEILVGELKAKKNGK